MDPRSPGQHVRSDSRVSVSSSAGSVAHSNTETNPSSAPPTPEQREAVASVGGEMDPASVGGRSQPHPLAPATGPAAAVTTMETLMPRSAVAGLPAERRAGGESGARGSGSRGGKDVLSRLAETHELRLSFVMAVTKKTLTSVKGTARTQISILRQVADLYDLSNYDTVTVTKIEKSEEASVLETISADFVMVHLKDQFVSRGEMFHFQKSFVGRWIYEGERLDSVDGVRAHAMEIRHSDWSVRSGVVTEDTKITFRSRSARIIWLVQISSEMWDYASPYEAASGAGAAGSAAPSAFGGQEGDEAGSCQIYFEKLVSFIYGLFEKWKELEVTHSLTVVFFSRTYLRSSSRIDATHGGAAVGKDVDGRLYEDHFKTVIENETRTDWDALVKKIKRAFIRYPIEVGWNLALDKQGRIPSTATQGNLLEAINTTLNLLQFHYMDRDLHRVGNSIVIVSAGCGVFEVNKGLAGITKQRMMDNGIGSDMLSLGLPPLHVAPFFLYKDVGRAQSEGANDFDDWKTYFEIPHWMHLSYVSYDQSHNLSPSQEHMLSSMSVAKVSGSAQAVHVAANGFIIQSTNEPQHLVSSPDPPALPKIESTATLTKFAEASHSQRQQRHLISGREFEDILEACRPRNRGDIMPSALVTLLKKSKPVQTQWDGKNIRPRGEAKSKYQETRTSSSLKERDRSDMLGEIVAEEPRNGSQSHLQEWGSVNFDEFGGVVLRPPKIASCLTLADNESPVNQLLAAVDNHTSLERGVSSSDKSSPSGSFSSHFSLLLGLSEEGNVFGNYKNSPSPHGIQLQPSLDLDIALLNPMSCDNDSNVARPRSHRSDDSLSTMCSDSPADQGQIIVNEPTRASQAHVAQGINNNYQKNSFSIQSLRNQFTNYDTNLFTVIKTERKSRANDSVAVVTPPTSMNMLDVPPVRTVSALWNMGNQRALDDADKLGVLLGHGIPHSVGMGQQTGGLAAALNQDNQMPRPLFSQRGSSGMGINNTRRLGHSDKPKTVTGGGGGMPPYGQQDEGSEWRRSPILTSMGIPVASDPPDRMRLGPTQPPPTGPNVYTCFKMLRESTQRVPSAGLMSPLVVGSLGSAEAPQMEDGQVDIPANTAVGARPLRLHPSSDVPDHGSSPSRHHLHSPKKLNHHRHHHNHHHHGSSHKDKKKKKHGKRSLHQPVSSSTGGSHTHRQKAWVLNPFRQQDEEEVLAKRTHNRRRWSHVFPIGEVEFKRHAGPNWKSLCQPAILPITIDYYPPPQELNDPAKFQFSHYEVTLDAIDRTYYKTHADLLMEMVTQRLIQDFQLVPQSVLNWSAHYGEVERKLKGGTGPLPDNAGLMNRRQSFQRILPPKKPTVQHTLSMGHRIHVLSYNPLSDAIEVVQYVARFAQNIDANIQTYRYFVWCPATQKYTKVVQKFSKYSDEYLWNRVDNLICGDQDKKLTEGTRFRRIMFRILPDRFSDLSQEQEYVKKFQRLLEYLSKQLLKEAAVERDIQIVTSADKIPDEGSSRSRPRRRQMDTFKYFTVQLKKGPSQKYQWMEWVMDSTFDTRRTYKIMLHWLVATSIKVETSVQLLQRRCSQYGLRLITFPQDSISGNVFLHPFIAPIVLPVRNKQKAVSIEQALVDHFYFIDDDNIMVDLKDIDGFTDFNFPVMRLGRVRKFSAFPAKQYVHHSGTLYVRLLRDEKGWVVFIIYENRRYIGGDSELLRIARGIFVELHNFFISVGT